MSDDVRLLDPDVLDRKREPRGRASIVVPREWMRAGARLEVALPPKVRCDLCDGGGCDACARSGAYVLPENRAPIVITLPRTSDDVFALRLTNPFAEAEPRMLVVRVAAGESASSGVSYVGPNHDVPTRVHPAVPPLPKIPSLPSWANTLILVLLTALVAVLARLSCR